MRALAAVAVLCATARAEVGADVTAALGTYAEQASKLHDARSRALDVYYSEAGCTAVLVAGRKAGMPPQQMMRASGFASIPQALAVDHTFALRFGDGPLVCAAFARWHRVAEAERALAGARLDFVTCNQIAAALADAPDATVTMHGAEVSLAGAYAHACQARRKSR